MWEISGLPVELLKEKAHEHQNYRSKTLLRIRDKLSVVSATYYKIFEIVNQRS